MSQKPEDVLEYCEIIAILRNNTIKVKKMLRTFDYYVIFIVFHRRQCWEISSRMKSRRGGGGGGNVAPQNNTENSIDGTYEQQRSFK